MIEASDMRPLGATGIMVSPIGLGTVKFGRNTDVKYPRDFDIPRDRELASLLSKAKALGINLLDTAPAYGESEERLGRLLEGQRQDWILGTKVGEYYDNERSSFDFGADVTRRSLENSLTRLRTDHFDYVLVHSDGRDEHIIRDTDVLQVLADAKKQGKIRSFGVSTKTVEGGLLALDMADIVMVTYNLHETDEQPVFEKARALNKGVLVKKGLASGHASDPAKSLQFVLGQAGVSSVIVGTINEQHLEANVTAVTAR